jgi:hypothetical protein
LLPCISKDCAVLKSRRTQLTWCQKEGVPHAIITHCGSEIVTVAEHKIAAKICAMAAERDVDVRIAYDGMKLTL